MNELWLGRDLGNSPSSFDTIAYKEGFQLVSDYPDRETKFTDVKTLEIIQRQKEAIKGILKKVQSELKKEEKEHKGKFKNEKLTDVFPKTLSYYTGKMYETIHSKKYPKPFDANHIKHIEETLEKLKQALEKRNLWGAYDSIKYLYEDLSFPIEEFKKYFEREDQSEAADKQAEINLFFIDKKMEELKGMAKEIDEDYSQTDDS